MLATREIQQRLRDAYGMEEGHGTLAYVLAGAAGCTSPDNGISPGADFLIRVGMDCVERIEWVDEYNGRADRISQARDQYDELRNEIADSAVPTYTHGLWSVFTDLSAWQEDLTEVGFEFDENRDMEDAARTALYMIAERLASDVLARLDKLDGIDVDDA